VLEKILEDLRSPDENMRKMAVRKVIPYVNNPQVVEVLKEVYLREKNVATKFFIKRLLEKAGVDVKSLTSSAGGRATDPRLADSSSQASTLSSTPKSTLPAVVQELMEKARGSNEDEAVEAIKKLAEFPYEEVCDFLIELTYSQSRKKRLYAVQSLGLLGIKKALPRLIEMANTEKDDFVKATLVKALARLGGVGEVEIVARFLKEADPRVRANTIEALEIISNPAAVKYVIPMLQDPNPRVRANAVRFLSKMGRADILEELKKLIQEGGNTAKAALFAIKQMKSRDAASVLVEVVDSVAEGIKQEIIKIMEEFADISEEVKWKLTELKGVSSGVSTSKIKDERQVGASSGGSSGNFETVAEVLDPDKFRRLWIKQQDLLRELLEGVKDRKKVAEAFFALVLETIE